MGHAEHFLQRLDRVNDRQVELALTLYRDEQLLDAVLRSVALPDGAERVALSLEDDELGPFVVVTREGRFVTCLAKGMRVDDLPIITRARFDIAAARVQRMQDELARLKQVSEEGGPDTYARLMRRLVLGGPRFCREDALALASVAPIMVDDMMQLASGLQDQINGACDLLLSLRFERLNPVGRDAVLRFDRCVWACAHLGPIIASHHTNPLLRFDEVTRRGVAALATLGFEWYTSLHGFRSLWCMLRTGKTGLHFARHHLSDSPMLSSGMFLQLVCGAFAFASRKVRAEAEKALSVAHEPFEFKEAYTKDEVLARLGALIAACLRTDPEQLRLACTARGLAHIAQRCPELCVDEQTLVASGAGDVALSALANVPLSLGAPENGRLLIDLPYALPWIGEASLGDLFLPRAWVERLIPVSTPKSVDAWFRRAPLMALKHAARTRIAAAQPKVGRNDPCPCGSGKKAKRCCVLASAKV